MMPMKRLIICSLICLQYIAAMASTERVFVSTDRSSYTSGERVWCSLFCLDGDGSLSQQSAVAYIELISTDGCAAQAKIALQGGRGAGEFVIPADAPTGNYRLLAYTSLEGGENALSGSKLLSVYNTGSLARVKDGVVPGMKAEESNPGDCSDGLTLQAPIKVRRGESFSLVLGGDTADVSVSVCHEDGLSQSAAPSFSDFLAEFPVSSEAAGPVEYDGETVKGSVLGASGDGLAILSSSGSSDDIYACSFGPDGNLLFNTGNIFGDRELVCEALNAGDNVRITLQSPFQHPSPGEIPVMGLHESQSDALMLRKRSLSMQYPTDTIVRFLPRREDQFLHKEDMTRFHLDDYTRFPSVSEVIVEILPMVRVRTHYGKKQLELAVADGASSRSVFMDHILVLMDGVMVTDFDLILGLDAMLLEDIYVCGERIVIGPANFNGVVNFVSKKNYVTALDFPNNVCVVDFAGARYPVAYLGESPQGEDLRQLLYWHPSLLLEGERHINLTAPGYSGRFCAVAEGLSADGKAVRAVVHFEVE